MPNLLTTFSAPKDLLALMPEELAGVLLEIIPSVSQSAGFLLANFMSQLFPVTGDGYPPAIQGDVEVALAEAMSWLETQGIIVPNPGQSAKWYLLTRRGRKITSRADLEAFRKGRALPVDLLQRSLADKIYHLFLRGDHDTAVFQAFKEVEVAVRKAGKYPDSLIGRDLMQKAFHPETGPLRDTTIISNERESEMFLFSGAIGHAKNPTGHRHVNLTREQAARLIVLASHLLTIVDERS